MKKILALIMILTMIMSVTACGSKDDNGDVEPQEEVTQEEDNNTSTDSRFTQEGFRTVVKTDDTWKLIKYAGPNDYKMIENAASQLYILSGEQVITVNTEVRETASSLEEARTVLWENQFKYAMSGDVEKLNDLNITKDEEVNVNGIDMLRFEGTMKANFWTEDVYELNTIGYVFMVDGYPGSIQGTIINKDPEEQKKQMDDLAEVVDGMIKTLKVTDMNE